MEELIEIKQNFCNIVGNMSLCSVNIKDCLFLEFDMPHIEQPLQLIAFAIKVNKHKKFFFSFVFKVMDYPQTRTQNFNLNQEKK